MDVVYKQRELTGAEKALLKLFKDSQHFDLKLDVKCGQSWKSYFVHKTVLSMWSPYFEDLLYRSSKKDVSTVEITDVLPSVLSAILTFMYGCSSEIYKNENNLKFVLDVYKAADKYQIAELKKLCCKILKFATPDKDNVFELLDAAIFTQLDTLRSRCFNVLETQTAEVLSSQDLANITSSRVTTILNLKSVSLSSEHELLSWVFDWAESEYNKLSQQASDSRSGIIQPYLPYLKFASLNAEQFQMLVQKYRDFFDEKEGFSIFMNILGPGSEPLPEWYNKSGILRSFTKPVEIDLLNPSEDHSNSSILSHTTSAKSLKHCVEDAANDSTSANHNATVDEPVCDSDQDIETGHKILNEAMEAFSRHSLDEYISLYGDNLQVEHVNDRSLDCTDLIGIPLDNSEMEPTGNCMSAVSGLMTTSEKGPILDPDSDCSWNDLEEPVKCRKKIRKKKIKKRYLLPGGRSLPSTHSWKSQDSSFASEDFDSLINTIWKQQCHRGITA